MVNLGGTCACLAHSMQDLVVCFMSVSIPDQYTKERAMLFIFNSFYMSCVYKSLRLHSGMRLELSLNV